MFCIKCGRQLLSDAAFCDKCGAKCSFGSAAELTGQGATVRIDPSNADGTATAERSPDTVPGGCVQQVDSFSKTKKHKAGALVIVAILAIVVIIIIADQAEEPSPCLAAACCTHPYISKLRGRAFSLSTYI